MSETFQDRDKESRRLEEEQLPFEPGTYLILTKVDPYSLESLGKEGLSGLLRSPIQRGAPVILDHPNDPSKSKKAQYTSPVFDLRLNVEEGTYLVVTDSRSVYEVSVGTKEDDYPTLDLPYVGNREQLGDLLQ